MQTIAFETIAHNGTIAIPEKYRELLPETVRLLVQIEPLQSEQGESKTFSAVRIATKTFKFNREEAHER